MEVPAPSCAGADVEKPASKSARPARVLVIGAYGNTGRGICRLLASRSDVRLRLAGRDPTRLERLASELRGCTAHSIDLLPIQFDRGCDLPAGVDLVVLAAGQTALVPEVARAAIAAGADVFDTHLSAPAKWSGLRAMRPAIEAAGRCIVTDCGLHPGVPGAVVRWVADEGLRLRSAQVFGAFALDWRSLRFSDAVVEEFAEELASMNPSALVSGTWRRSYALQRGIDFGQAVGRRTCTPMMLEEIRELPAVMPTLRDAGFYVAGFGWAVDYLAMPACMLLAGVGRSVRRRAGRLLLTALRRWNRADRYAVVVLEAEGSTATVERCRVRVRVAARDAYALTSACVVAAVEQWLEGRRPTGLWTQAAYVVPAEFFRRIGEMGADVSVVATSPLAAGA
jgi:saccharopine dehydrogenase (NAD+, L-lysine-forming)